MYHLERYSRIRILVCVSLLQLLATNTISAQFVANKSAQGIEILENGSKVLFYQSSPKSVNGLYERAGYIHPLYNLDGTIITEDAPEDHPYHRGIFWAWHQIVLKNKKIADGWVSENISFLQGKVSVKKNSSRASIQSELIWKYNDSSSQPRSIVKENTLITIFRASEEYRVIDFDIHLSALIDSLAIGGSEDNKGYGGFCLRLKLPANISFNSNGVAVTPQETAVTAAPWMDFSGSFSGVDSSRSGISVFCTPGQTNGQQQWILRSQKSMQNVVNPGNIAQPLSKKGWRLKYRVIIHSAKVDGDYLKKLYQQFINLP